MGPHRWAVTESPSLKQLFWCLFMQNMWLGPNWPVEKTPENQEHVFLETYCLKRLLGKLNTVGDDVFPTLSLPLLPTHTHTHTHTHTRTHTHTHTYTHVRTRVRQDLLGNNITNIFQFSRQSKAVAERALVWGQLIELECFLSASFQDSLTSDIIDRCSEVWKRASLFREPSPLHCLNGESGQKQKICDKR